MTERADLLAELERINRRLARLRALPDLTADEAGGYSTGDLRVIVALSAGRAADLDALLS